MVTRDPVGNQIITNRLGATCAELLIVRGISRLIGITGHHHVGSVSHSLFGKVIQLGILLYRGTVNWEKAYHIRCCGGIRQILSRI